LRNVETEIGRLWAEAMVGDGEYAAHLAAAAKLVHSAGLALHTDIIV
jgi:hypothetical protein